MRPFVVSTFGAEWRTKHPTVRLDDPDYRWRALLFNAVTAHPDTYPLLFSTRQRLADRLEQQVTHLIHMEVQQAEKRWKKKLQRWASE